VSSAYLFQWSDTHLFAVCFVTCLPSVSTGKARTFLRRTSVGRAGTCEVNSCSASTLLCPQPLILNPYWGHPRAWPFHLARGEHQQAPRDVSVIGASRTRIIEERYHAGRGRTLRSGPGVRRTGCAKKGPSEQQPAVALGRGRNEGARCGMALRAEQPAIYFEIVCCHAGG
jgi:hypothetical protein